jgi:hypothetical protein
MAKIPQYTTDKDSSKMHISQQQLRTLVGEVESLMNKSKQDQNPIYSLIHLTGALCKVQMLQLFGPKVEKQFKFDINDAKSQIKALQTTKIQEIQSGDFRNRAVVPDAVNFYA